MVAAKLDDLGYEMAVQRWMKDHIRRAAGERKRKLSEGLSFAEHTFLRNVWYVAFGNFDCLHPQYEIRDFKDGVRFVDFVYIRGGLRLAIEIDPYGTHARNLSRWEHDDQLDRHNDLVLDDWRVLRFSLDQVEKYQRKCQQKLQQGLGKWGAVQDGQLPTHPIDQAIIKYFRLRGEALSPSEVARALGWHRSTISKHMHKLVKHQHLVAIDKSKQNRVTKYAINSERNNA